MTDSQPRRLDYMTVEEIQPALRNPKRHDLVGLRKSITRWGFADPAILDERTGRLIGGHGRTEMVAALEGLGERPNDWPADKAWPPEGIVVGADGRWRLPVTRGWASIDDEEAHALGVALNRGTISGGWDDKELASLLDSFRAKDDELLGAAGFTGDDLTDMLARYGPPPSLDDLEDRHGDPDPTTLWPVLRFKIPPEIRDRFTALTKTWEGGDVECFTRLLGLAETAAKAGVEAPA